MSVDKFIRLTCFHCSERLELPVRQFRSFEKLNKALLRNKWIFGVESRRPGVAVFDALCPTHGRETMRRIVEAGGGEMEPEVRETIQRLYPDVLATEEPN